MEEEQFDKNELKDLPLEEIYTRLDNTDPEIISALLIALYTYAESIFLLL